METVEDILKTNATYDANIARWAFYLRSYMGGAEYAGGKYLTPYIEEDAAEYDKRIDSTPCDNHCHNIIQIYNSFIWRIPPTRSLPEGNQAIESFMDDADLDGRTFNAFMREAGTWSGVYGHCVIMMDKPESTAETMQDEIDQGLRPYVSVVTPDNILDWRYERAASGRYVLTYIKYREGFSGDTVQIREWSAEEVNLYEVEGERAKLLESVPNPIGLVPAITLYSSRSPLRGVGISDISDIADFQKAIYSELSEIEQLIRISNHPSLAKTEGTDASAGAGGVITMPDDMDGATKPFLLQPSGASLGSVMESIDKKVEAINRMGHLGGVRSTQASSAKSGVALQTEFQMLNTRLSEKADLLELAEEQLWKLWDIWQGTNADIEVDYPDSFDIRDYASDLEFFQMAKASGVNSKTFQNGVDYEIASLVLDDDKLETAKSEIDQGAIFTEPDNASD